MAESKPVTVFLASDDPTLSPTPGEGLTITTDPRAEGDAELLLLDARTSRDMGPLKRWRERTSETYRPALVLTADRGRIAEWLAAGADACLSGAVEPELLQSQVRALARVVESQRRLADRAGQVRELNRQLQEAYRQAERDLALAYHLARQESPRTILEFGRVRVAITHRPRGRIGGDFFGVARLDEDHVALYLADATGRGPMTSGLLSVLLRRSIALKEILGRSYRLVEPDEVMASLDAEIRALAMDELPLVSMICARIAGTDGHVTYSRAAGPAPLHVPREGVPAFWEGEPGTFLGSSGGSYPSLKGQLRPGDRLVFYSDGVRPADQPDATERLLKAAGRTHADLQSYLDHLTGDLLADRPPGDDFTLIGVQYDA